MAVGGPPRKLSSASISASSSRRWKQRITNNATRIAENKTVPSICPMLLSSHVYFHNPPFMQRPRGCQADPHRRHRVRTRHRRFPAVQHLVHEVLNLRQVGAFKPFHEIRH